ncbi:MAG: MoxR family ATPase [Candidatus Melainabacteria bacterium]|nr:MoxR family ATPase [Candidatus Melainabacteria bacterium]
MNSTNPVQPAVSNQPELQHIADVAKRLRDALETVVFGQPRVIDRLLVGLLSEGHLLLEGIPGTAKTTLVKLLSQLIQADFRRVQLTPDLLPAEITGTNVFDLNERSFHFRPGPVFTDILLADEINRTPPKTQSALLEAMEEHQVTVDGVKHLLSPLFTVIATLNPIEFEGTYPLPEAQLDRFMMKIEVSYPEGDAEKQMLQAFVEGAGVRFFQQRTLSPVTTRDEILACRKALRYVHLEAPVMDYLLAIVQHTRQTPLLSLGCSPRAALSLLTASRAYAAIQGQAYVTPDHVKAMAPGVLCHRMMVSPEADLDNLRANEVLTQILGQVPVPR